LLAALLLVLLSPDKLIAGLHPVRVMASSQSAGEVQALPNSALSSITIDYPQDASIFPQEITPPTFIWRDPNEAANSWRVEVVFGDHAKAVHSNTSGEPMQMDEIDARCISSTNELPKLTPEQAAAHTWKPSVEEWNFIKQHSIQRAAKVTITGLDAVGKPLQHAVISLTTSNDPVNGQIFYRDVPLMPSDGKKGTIQPLAPSNQPLINWRLRDIGQPESKIVLHDMYTCANCHSFSADGKTMGMDVDGPGNDKGLYAVLPVQKQMTIHSEDLVAWNTDRTVGKTRVGFMSQVSPDGQYVLSTFAGVDQSIPSSFFVTNFTDYHFLQVFYPTRGVLQWYSRATGLRKLLPGADDPRFAQCNGVWSPDGKYIVFARAEARDPFSPNQTLPLRANDPNETQVQYSLYRIPFNNGLGGKAEPIVGASNNGMSNSFPKLSPDGKWIVFVKSKNALLMRPDSELWIVPAAGGAARRMRANMSPMNSWHSFSPNGRWLVFSSKSRSPYTQMYLTHINADGSDSPPIYVDHSTASNRAVNLPEFVNIPPGGIEQINVPLSDLYRLIDQAVELKNKGDKFGSLAKWQEAVGMDPDSSLANDGLGTALAVVGRMRDAIPYLKKATELDSEFFGAYFNLGAALVADNQSAESIDAWQNVLRLRPNFPQAMENLGLAYWKQARYADAIEQFRLELAGAPDRVIALNLAASLLATCPEDSLRNGGEAVTLADRANRITEGKIPQILDTLSAAYAETSRFPEAIEAEQKAIVLVEQQGNEIQTATLKAHLENYQANRPLREPPDASLF
jgi:tetratricopeptide (TPR) repeat protein